MTSQSYTIDIYGDGAVEGDETFNVVLSNPVNATIADDTGVVTIINDDRAKLLAASSSDSSQVLSSEALAPIVDEAISRWETSIGRDIPAFDNIIFTIADLPGLTLGEALDANTILIDTNAAGNGWFIDPTPADNAEFTDSDAPSGMDLVTVVMHELGHVLGLEDLLDKKQ